MRTRGFTLIEMILTIIVGSILVLGIAGFVELGSRGLCRYRGASADSNPS